MSPSNFHSPTSGVRHPEHLWNTPSSVLMCTQYKDTETIYCASSFLISSSSLSCPLHLPLQFLSSCLGSVTQTTPLNLTLSLCRSYTSSLIQSLDQSMFSPQLYKRIFLFHLSGSICTSQVATWFLGSHLKFLKPQEMSLNVVFGPTKCPKIKDIEFIIRKERKNLLKG